MNLFLYHENLEKNNEEYNNSLKEMENISNTIEFPQFYLERNNSLKKKKIR